MPVGPDSGSPPIPVSGPDDRPREVPIDRAFDRIVEEGRPRLFRSNTELISTGLVGGIEVAFGVLALLVVEQATASVPLGGLAFSVGFVALLLGHSELFTEGFLVPVTVVAARRARLRDLLRLWAGTLAGNLAGGWGMAWLMMHGFPELHAQAVKSAAYFIETPIGGRSFVLAVLAGSAITLLTRMHNGTESDGAKLVASVVVAFVLAGLRLFHSVLDSLLAFMALTSGRAPFGYLDWGGWFGMTLLGNVVGGVGLTTLLRLLVSHRRLGEHRAAVSGPRTPG